MQYIRVLCFFLLSLFLTCCSCGSVKKETFRIGIDPYWYPLNFETFQPYVNGFTDDLLLEMSRYTGIEWVKIEVNWDGVLSGLQEGKYDAILTPFPAYAFNQVKYDFSKNFLNLGPVLVVPANAPAMDLSKLSNEVVGVVRGDPAILLLHQYPEIIVRKYETTPELLGAIVAGSLEGALLDHLVACSYIRDLYAQQLKIATGSLTDAGLHLVALKGRQKRLVDLFNQTLSQFKKQQKLQALKKKWQLCTDE